MPSSPIDAPIFPPAPCSMYTVPPTFVTLISTLSKLRSWAKQAPAAKHARIATLEVVRMNSSERRNCNAASDQGLQKRSRTSATLEQIAAKTLQPRRALGTTGESYCAASSACKDFPSAAWRSADSLAPFEVR